MRLLLRRVLIPVAATAIVFVPGVALAYWSSGGTGSGSGTTGTLNPPTSVTVPANSTGSVHVSWSASSGGTTPQGYYVTRISNSDGSSANVCNSSPSSLIGGNSCDDTGVADGTYHYTVTAVYHSWTAMSAVSGNVTVNSARHLVFGQGPTSTSAGTAISPAVTVAVKDAFDQAVQASGISITIAFGTNAGGGTLSGTKTQNTNAGGVATFNDLSIDKAGTGYTLTASATNIAGVTSEPFNITAGAATQLVFTTQPAGAAAGLAFTTQPAVAVEDAFGNVVTSDGSTITLTKTGGTPTSGGPGALSGCTGSRSNGVTSFSGCAIDLSGVGYKLHASNGSRTTDSAAFAVTPRVISVQLVNGGTQGRVDKGDSVAIQFSGQMDATTFCSPTWSNSGSQTVTGNNVVTVTVAENGGNDTLTVAVSNAACGGTFKLGSIALGGDYVSATTTFSGTGSGGNMSTISLATSGLLTVTLGAGSGDKTGVPNGTPVYTPASGLKDISGQALPTSAVSGTGSHF